MSRRILAIAFIYLITAVAWMVLGGSVAHRSAERFNSLNDDVTELWGAPQSQRAPQLTLVWEEDVNQTETVKDEKTERVTWITRKVKEKRTRSLILNSSSIQVGLDLAHRQRGLLWYTTYGVDFAGKYSYVHDHDQAGTLVIEHRFPQADASYDNFIFQVAGQPDAEIISDTHGRAARHQLAIAKGQRVEFTLAYRTRGLSTWRYDFGDGVERVRNFDLTLDTNFKAIDFPQSTMAASSKEHLGNGWRLRWQFQNLISGFALGMKLPDHLNPGPLAGQISFFAPICLGFFFVWIFVITLIRKIDLHPMNYLFLAAAFFAFHLLFAYSVAHISIGLAFTICSLVSVGLVITYLRLVVGLGFAVFEAGLSQLVYLVMFSYAHFYEGFTGLIVTIGSILTLFCLMQLTGRMKWSGVFARPAEGSEVAQQTVD